MRLYHVLIHVPEQDMLFSYSTLGEAVKKFQRVMKARMAQTGKGHDYNGNSFAFATQWGLWQIDENSYVKLYENELET